MTAEGMHGVIMKGIGGFYTVLADNGLLYTLRARGIFRKQKITPLVGDTVVFCPPGEDEEGWMDQILPEKTYSYVHRSQTSNS